MEVSEEIIRSAVDRFSAVRSQGVLPNVLAFGRVLKQVGIMVGLSQVMDASRSVGLVDIGRKSDFRAVLLANLVSQKEEIPVFDQVFDLFWQDAELERLLAESMEDLPRQVSAQDVEAIEDAVEEIYGESEGKEEESSADSDSSPFPTYSSLEGLIKKDFSEMGIEESRAVARALLLIATKIATQVSRRKKVQAKGDEVDLRRSLRRNLKYGGEMIQLVRRRRRIKKTRVVLLCDVSGSMDCYSRFLIQFMYGLQNELWGVETFVFSTSLSRITHLIRTKDIANALERISTSVLGWSGGTNIGRSLQTFNREFAPSLVTHRTVTVVISDGWDRGDVTLLEQEMKDLKRRSYKVIWLNPLLASENYKPLCKGMQAALPYIDLFLSVHNLNSLVALGRTLQRIAA